MPVFNAGIFLRPAVESILGQTMGDFEFLLMDDGSSDGSPAYLASLTDSRVRLLTNRRNLGIPRTRNLAMGEARGKFIAFLDHDNLAHAERFARQVEYLHEHPEIGMLGSAIDNLTAEGRFLNRAVLPSEHLDIRWAGLLDRPVRQSAMMARRALVVHHRLGYDETFASNSDYNFVERLTRVATAANLPESLTSYRHHATNHSKVHHRAFVETGNLIALAAIQHELPTFAITLEQVAAVRATVLSYKLAEARQSLAQTKAGWEVYLDLFEAFRDKYRDHPRRAALHALAGPE